jgi:hypothetical protein
VIGVAPEGFKGVTSIFGPDLWLPSMMAPQVLPRQFGDWLHDRGMLAIGPDTAAAPPTTIAPARLEDVCATMSTWLGVPVPDGSGQPIRALVG